MLTTKVRRVTMRLDHEIYLKSPNRWGDMSGMTIGFNRSICGPKPLSGRQWADYRWRAW